MFREFESHSFRQQHRELPERPKGASWKDDGCIAARGFDSHTLCQVTQNVLQRIEFVIQYVFEFEKRLDTASSIFYRTGGVYGE